MKILQKGASTFCFLMLFFLIDQNVFAQRISAVNSPKFSVSYFEIKSVLNTDKQARDLEDFYAERGSSTQNSQLLPFPGEKSFSQLKMFGLSNKYLILSFSVVGLLFLVLSYKTKITLDIYEFYNRGADGIVKFNDIQSLKQHQQGYIWGDIYLGSGIFLCLLSLFLFLF